MDFAVEAVTDEETDFGSVIITPGEDDFFSVQGTSTSISIEFGLYNHEAKQLIEVLQIIASKKSL